MSEQVRVDERVERRLREKSEKDCEEAGIVCARCSDRLSGGLSSATSMHNTGRGYKLSRMSMWLYSPMLDRRLRSKFDMPQRVSSIYVGLGPSSNHVWFPASKQFVFQVNLTYLKSSVGTTEPDLAGRSRT